MLLWILAGLIGLALIGFLFRRQIARWIWKWSGLDDFPGLPPGCG